MVKKGTRRWGMSYSIDLQLTRLDFQPQTPGQIRFFTESGETQTVFYPLPLSESCHQAGDVSATILGCNLYLKSSSPVKAPAEGDAGPATHHADKGPARHSPRAMNYPLGNESIFPCFVLACASLPVAFSGLFECFPSPV